jgi:hypothetical protein
MTVSRTEDIAGLFPLLRFCERLQQRLAACADVRTLFVDEPLGVRGGKSEYRLTTIDSRSGQQLWARYVGDNKLPKHTWFPATVLKIPYLAIVVHDDTVVLPISDFSEFDLDPERK